jgi:uridine kinase
MNDIQTPDTIAETIRAGLRSHRPIAIGVEGYGGSGKTTFADKLRDALGSAFVVHIDDFAVREKINEPSWDKGGFDRERLEQQVLIPATTGQSIQYQKLLWKTNTLSRPETVPVVDYLIVEGISCYHPNIAHYYDYRVWVDTPIEIAKARGMARDTGTENEDKWDVWAENDLAYQHKYHPERVANFVVSGV